MAGFVPTLSLLQSGDDRRDRRMRSDRAEARLEEDRALARDDRSRRIRLEDADRTEAAIDRGQTRELRGVQIDAARRGLDTAETPEEAAARRGDEATARKQALAAGRLQLSEAEQRMIDAKATRAQRDALPVIHEIGTLIDRDPEALTDQDAARFVDAWKAYGVDLGSVLSPEFGEAATALGEAMRSGNVADRSTLPAWNIVFKDRLNRTAGEQTKADLKRHDGMGNLITIPKGSKILDRELVGVREVPGGVQGIVQVGYQTPDGAQGTYFGPITKSRTAGAEDDPLVISPEEAMRQFTGREVLRRSLTENPAVKSRIDAFLNARGAASGSEPTGAMGKDLDYLTRNYTGGDKAAAVELYKNLRSSASKPKNERFEIVKALIQSLGRTPREQEVNDLMKLTGSGAADAGPAAAGTGGGGDYVEGQVYEDANGNRAVYQDGQFHALAE